MNSTPALLIAILLAVLFFLPHMMIIVVFPSQCCYCAYKKQKNEGKVNNIMKLLAVPYFVFDMKLMRGGWMRYSLIKMSTFPSNHVRKWFYIALGAKVGTNAVFHYRTEIRSPFCLSVGSGSVIGDNALLDARNGLTIGEHVNLSSNVSIYTEQHNHRDPLFRCNQQVPKEVVIEDRAWLGSNVIILPGVHIGEGAVCCAGCVVNKDVPPYAVVAGIPAHKVSERPHQLEYCFDGKTCRLY